LRFFCNKCSKSYQVNRSKKNHSHSSILLDHLDGLSFRKLSDKYDISVGSAHNYIMSKLETLPHCADLTRQYSNKYCGIVLTDGKFIKVGGYEHKIPVLYGIDYLTHDIPTYILAPSENYQVCRKFFNALRLLNYPLRRLVSDDNSNIYEGCKSIYPNVVRQLCLNHYKENLRKLLQVRTDDTYKQFMYEIMDLFRIKRSKQDFNRLASIILQRYSQDSLCVKIMLDIEQNKVFFSAHHLVQHTPRTNNLIESYNSHLNGRLKTIKGFQSFKHANLWLNGYFIRRRIKKFTDCSGKFKRLNGHSSLELSSSNFKEGNLLLF